MNIDFSKITFIEIIDVLLVGILLFLVFKILKGSIARNVFIGCLFVFLTYLAVNALGMKILTIILGEFMRWGVLGLIIIFQQEIRRFLQLIGQSASFQNNSFLKKFYKPMNRAESPTTLQAVIEATKAMATAHIGALIVIHKDHDLSRFIETGDEIDSLISKRLIISIFSKNSPLHDGAIIIQGDRIRSVRCSLPISESGTISPTLGFRHRAAIGMSEHTDAAIIVISEENGEMSLVYTGQMFRKLTISQLETQLTSYLEK
jgi:diadenylate cyclase